MIILGILLLVLGIILPLHLLFVLGIVLLVIGVALELAGSFGAVIGNRRHYW